LVQAGGGLLLNAQTDVRYDVTTTQNVMVPMRDGVHLATDVYRPVRKWLARRR